MDHHLKHVAELLFGDGLPAALDACLVIIKKLSACEDPIITMQNFNRTLIQSILEPTPETIIRAFTLWAYAFDVALERRGNS